MKKAVEITMVDICEGNVEVHYITGTVRKYPEDKIPKTVQSWMAEHPAYTLADQAEDEWVEAIDQDDMDRATFMMQTAHPGMELVPMEPTQFPAVVETTTTLVTTETAEEATEKAEKATAEGTQRKSLNDAGRAVWNGLKAVVAMLPVAGAVAIDILRALVVVGAWLLDKIISGYYLTTTYLPIWGKRVAFVVVWDVLPAIKAGWKATKAGLVAVKAGAKAFGAVAISSMVVVAGWLATGLVVAVSVATKTGKAIQYGWSVREALVNEDRERMAA